MLGRTIHSKVENQKKKSQSPQERYEIIKFQNQNWDNCSCSRAMTRNILKKFVVSFFQFQSLTSPKCFWVLIFFFQFRREFFVFCSWFSDWDSQKRIVKFSVEFLFFLDKPYFNHKWASANFRHIWFFDPRCTNKMFQETCYSTFPCVVKFVCASALVVHSIHHSL